MPAHACVGILFDPVPLYATHMQTLLRGGLSPPGVPSVPPVFAACPAKQLLAYGLQGSDASLHLVSVVDMAKVAVIKVSVGRKPPAVPADEARARWHCRGARRTHYSGVKLVVSRLPLPPLHPSHPTPCIVPALPPTQAAPPIPWLSHHCSSALEFGVVYCGVSGIPVQLLHIFTWLVSLRRREPVA
eukprot:353126-Chlamydomonas_euryale.AAC.4